MVPLSDCGQSFLLGISMRTPRRDPPPLLQLGFTPVFKHLTKTWTSGLASC